MRKGKTLRFERLENRRLLAADLGYDVMESCNVEPPPMESCMVAPEIVESAEQEICVDPIAPDQGPLDEPATVDPAVTLDLEDGMDGYFGTLDADHQSDTLRFTANADGMVDVVVASSFGESSTILQVFDTTGNLVAASETEGLEGFATLRFAADGDQSYDLLVSSADGGQGNFQVTIGMEGATNDLADEGPFSPEDCEVDDVVDEALADDLSDSPDDFIDEADCDENTAGPLDEPVSSDAEDCVATEDDSDASDTTETVEELDEVVEDAAGDSIDDDLADTESDAGPDSDSELDDILVVDDPADESIEDETDIVDCGDVQGADADLHADVIGSDATTISFTDGAVNIDGDLETVDDTDVFRFTSPASGQISLFAGEVSDQNVDLDVSVFDDAGNQLVDGATNEAVKITFDAQQDAEYFVAVKSAEDQGGSYEVLMEISEEAIVDDHANSIGDEATLLDNATGSTSTTGILEVAEDTDAFRFTAVEDGEVVLNLQVESQDHAADAQVSVYRDGELIADGYANETVGLRFDASANVQYQVLVDSANDIAMSYEMTTTEFSSLSESSDLFVDAGPAQEHATEETAIDSEPVVCTFENECADEELTDEVFSEFGGDDLAAADLDDEGIEIGDLVSSPDFQWAFSFDGDRFYSRFNGI